MATLRNLIEEFGANGCVREDRGNGCAGPVWVREDDLGELDATEMTAIDVTEDREAVAAYQAVMQAEMPFYASAWIDGGNGYEFRLIF